MFPGNQHYNYGYGPPPHSNRGPYVQLSPPPWRQPPPPPPPPWHQPPPPGQMSPYNSSYIPPPQHHQQYPEYGHNEGHHKWLSVQKETAKIDSLRNKIYRKIVKFIRRRGVISMQSPEIMEIFKSLTTGEREFVMKEGTLHKFLKACPHLGCYGTKFFVRSDSQECAVSVDDNDEFAPVYENAFPGYQSGYGDCGNDVYFSDEEEKEEEIGTAEANKPDEDTEEFLKWIETVRNSSVKRPSGSGDDSLEAFVSRLDKMGIKVGEEEPDEEEPTTPLADEKPGMFQKFLRNLQKSGIKVELKGEKTEDDLCFPGAVQWSEAFEDDMNVDETECEENVDEEIIGLVDDIILGKKDDVHSEEDDIPYKEDDIPDNEDDIPVNEEDIPGKEDDIPDNEDDIPDNEDDILVNDDDIPVNEDDIPDNEDDIPVKEDDIPGKEEDIPGKEEDIHGKDHDVLGKEDDDGKDAEENTDDVRDTLGKQDDGVETEEKDNKNEGTDNVDVGDVPEVSTSALNIHSPVFVPGSTNIKLETKLNIDSPAFVPMAVQSHSAMAVPVSPQVSVPMSSPLSSPVVPISVPSQESFSMAPQTPAPSQVSFSVPPQTPAPVPPPVPPPVPTEVSYSMPPQKPVPAPPPVPLQVSFSMPSQTPAPVPPPVPASMPTEVSYSMLPQKPVPAPPPVPLQVSFSMPSQTPVPVSRPVPAPVPTQVSFSMPQQTPVLVKPLAPLPSHVSFSMASQTPVSVPPAVPSQVSFSMPSQTPAPVPPPVPASMPTEVSYSMLPQKPVPAPPPVPLQVSFSMPSQTPVPVSRPVPAPVPTQVSFSMPQQTPVLVKPLAPVPSQVSFSMASQTPVSVPPAVPSQVSFSMPSQTLVPVSTPVPLRESFSMPPQVPPTVPNSIPSHVPLQVPMTPRMSIPVSSPVIRHGPPQILLPQTSQFSSNNNTPPPCPVPGCVPVPLRATSLPHGSACSVHGLQPTQQSGTLLGYVGRPVTPVNTQPGLYPVQVPSSIKNGQVVNLTHGRQIPVPAPVHVPRSEPSKQSVSEHSFQSEAVTSGLKAAKALAAVPLPFIEKQKQWSKWKKDTMCQTDRHECVATKDACVATRKTKISEVSSQTTGPVLCEVMVNTVQDDEFDPLVLLNGMTSTGVNTDVPEHKDKATLTRTFSESLNSKGTQTKLKMVPKNMHLRALARALIAEERILELEAAKCIDDLTRSKCDISMTYQQEVTMLCLSEEEKRVIDEKHQKIMCDVDGEIVRIQDLHLDNLRRLRDGAVLSDLPPIKVTIKPASLSLSEMSLVGAKDLAEKSQKDQLTLDGPSSEQNDVDGTQPLPETVSADVKQVSGLAESATTDTENSSEVENLKRARPPGLDSLPHPLAEDEIAQMEKYVGQSDSVQKPSALSVPSATVSTVNPIVLQQLVTMQILQQYPMLGNDPQLLQMFVINQMGIMMRMQQSQTPQIMQQSQTPQIMQQSQTPQIMDVQQTSCLPAPVSEISAFRSVMSDVQDEVLKTTESREENVAGYEQKSSESSEMTDLKTESVNDGQGPISQTSSSTDVSKSLGSSEVLGENSKEKNKLDLFDQSVSQPLGAAGAPEKLIPVVVATGEELAATKKHQKTPISSLVKGSKSAFKSAFYEGKSRWKSDTDPSKSPMELSALDPGGKCDGFSGARRKFRKQDSSDSISSGSGKVEPAQSAAAGFGSGYSGSDASSFVPTFESTEDWDDECANCIIDVPTFGKMNRAARFKAPSVSEVVKEACIVGLSKTDAKKPKGRGRHRGSSDGKENDSTKPKVPGRAAPISNSSPASDSTKPKVPGGVAALSKDTPASNGTKPKVLGGAAAISKDTPASNGARPKVPGGAAALAKDTPASNGTKPKVPGGATALAEDTLASNEVEEEVIKKPRIEPSLELRSGALDSFTAVDSSKQKSKSPPDFMQVSDPFMPKFIAAMGKSPEKDDDSKEEWQQVTKKKRGGDNHAATAEKKSSGGHKKVNNFERLISNLQNSLPDQSREDILGLIKEVRNRHGGLQGLTLNTIIMEAQRISKEQSRASQEFQKYGNTDQNKSSSNALHESNSYQSLGKNPSTGRSLRDTAKLTSAPTPNHPDNKPIGRSTGKSLESDDDMDNMCVICYDPLTSLSTKTLDCGHVYHDTCIEKWVYSVERTCPMCRSHALLPEEFPRLT